jgi:hypothetical protein
MRRQKLPLTRRFAADPLPLRRKIYDCAVIPWLLEESLRRCGVRLREFFKKPWWVGPLAAGVAVSHPHADKPARPADLGEQKVAASAVLPRYGQVVVVAACPPGMQINRGGYTLPSQLSRASSSRAEGAYAWRVAFKSFGGSGKAEVYAVCTPRK